MDEIVQVKETEFIFVDDYTKLTKADVEELINEKGDEIYGHSSC